MTGLEPRTSDIRNDRFANWATTIAPEAKIFITLPT